jgi:hypothetical protein
MGFVTTLADMKETTSQWRKDINKELDQVSMPWSEWASAAANAANKIKEIKGRKDLKPAEDKPYKPKTFEEIFGKPGISDWGDDTGGGTGGAGGDGVSPTQKAFNELQAKSDYMLKTNQWTIDQVYSQWSSLQSSLGLLDEASAKKKEDGLEVFRNIESIKADLVQQKEQEITKAVAEENAKRQKEIQESYDKRRKEIEKFYKDIEDKETGQDLEEKRRRLLIKRQSYEKATSAEGLAELAKVNKEIEDVTKEINKQGRQLEKETKLSDLEEDKNTSLESLEKSSSETLNKIEEAGNKTSVKLQGFLSTANSLKNKFFESGKNLADGFIKGFGTLNTNFGKAIGAVTSGTKMLANPAGALAYGGTVNTYNAPLVTVQNAYFKDKVDIDNFGKEIYRNVQKANTAKGGRM